jgi:glycosyltransferase involved in cell wall biosynthesis
MKIGIILGALSVGPRPFDFYNIWNSNRGLTGTDLSAVMISLELVKLGHCVHLFTVHINKNITKWEDVNIHSLEERTIIDDTFDCVISINEPNMFMDLKCTKVFRICWQFWNDFGYCNPGYENYVDKFLGASKLHTHYLKQLTPCPEKWDFLELGCTPEWYEDRRVPGRVVWCSSADRGLHWLLQEWPKIKNQVPEATLKIFYHFNFNTENTEAQETQDHIKEIGQRVRYIKESILRLKNFGVQHVGSISRNQMKKELSEASVLGFCCDTVSFTEGFSIATLEGCASFTVPVITDKDCLGDVYKNSGALIVQSPLSKNASQYSDLVIKALKDKYFSDCIIKKCTDFSMKKTWKNVAQNLENIIKAGAK